MITASNMATMETQNGLKTDGRTRINSFPGKRWRLEHRNDENTIDRKIRLKNCEMKMVGILHPSSSATSVAVLVVIYIFVNVNHSAKK